MQLKAPGFLAGISLCVALFAGFGYGADVKLPAVAGIRRIDIGPVDSISSIRSAPNGDLVILVDHAKAIQHRCRFARWAPSIERQCSRGGGADRRGSARLVVERDGEGNFYLLRSGEPKLWMISQDGSASRSMWGCRCSHLP